MKKYIACFGVCLLLVVGAQVEAQVITEEIAPETCQEETEKATASRCIMGLGENGFGLEVERYRGEENADETEEYLTTAIEEGGETEEYTTTAIEEEQTLTTANEETETMEITGAKETDIEATETEEMPSECVLKLGEEKDPACDEFLYGGPDEIKPPNQSMIFFLMLVSGLTLIMFFIGIFGFLPLLILLLFTKPSTRPRKIITILVCIDLAFIVVGYVIFVGLNFVKMG